MVAILLAAGVRHFYALVSFGLCVFVTWTIVSEFLKGAFAIRARTGMNLVRAMVELTHRNTRRYGGYVVHMGIVLMFVGFTGAAFNQDSTVEVKVGDRFRIGRYELAVTDMRDGDNENYSWNQATVAVLSRRRANCAPSTRRGASTRPASSPTPIVSIRRRLNEDLYLNFAGMSNDNQKAVMQAYVFPLVSWIWIGFWVVMFGTVVCLVPAKQRLDYARTQVVAVKEGYAPVEK